MWVAIGVLSLGIWMVLLLARGGFWLFREVIERDDLPVPEGRSMPSVAVIIPARDEAESIGDAVRSLVASRYDGPLRVFVIDDHSSDGTADIARQAGGDPVTVISSRDLPPGWTGKLWAVAQGVEAASRTAPDFFLLTDADIVHAPGNVARLVARAQRDRLDLASVMVRLHCRTLAERFTVPAFVLFFFKLYPPAWIANPRSSVAGAAGGCILIRPEVLARIGGIAAIRSELIDDCALARRAKSTGGRIWLGISRDTESIRPYATFAAVREMIARTAFTQLRHSALLLAGTLAGMALIYLAPPLLLFAPNNVARALGLAAWILMSAAYIPALRFYRQPVLLAPLLPLTAAFYTFATVESAVRYWRGSGGMWKGRVQDSKP
ncbi:MAG: glycosyltransferase [Bryobacteraceae bacterium]|jgi:hopene-associated glycosyltransferase HpnB